MNVDIYRETILRWIGTSTTPEHIHACNEVVFSLVYERFYDKVDPAKLTSIMDELQGAISDKLKTIPGPENQGVSKNNKVEV